MRILLTIASLFCLMMCQEKHQKTENDTIPTATEIVSPVPMPPVKSAVAMQLDSLGYQNIAEQDSSIMVSLMYTRADNFTGEILYNELKEAYLHPDAMRCLLKAQQLLKARRPDLTLAVYDAARPMSVQQKMWNAVKGTSVRSYVSNPAHGGGMHNYGVAVDLTLATLQGDTLPMGTKIDHLGKEANINNEAALVRQGKMTTEAWENRKLLREVMKQAGFKTLPSEWWHFNLVSRNEAKRKYKVIP